MTQKELGYVELEWTCKHCGTINPGMKRVCTNCGAPIAQDDKFDLPDQQEMITDKAKLEEAKAGPTIQCPYCNVLNPATAKLCIQCGGDIQEGLARKAGEVLGAFSTAPVPDKSCPSCGQMVKANADRCPYCGGSLKQATTLSTTNPPAQLKKSSKWLVIAGIAVGILCLVGVIALIILGSRTNEVSAMVTDLRWQRSIQILESQLVQRGAWEDQLPAGAESISCRDEYRQTSSVPAPKSTEECGTPYTVDTGSGAGKVVQDCEYLVYDSYCNFLVQELVVVNTVESMGSDLMPSWPVANLQAGQQEGGRTEAYQVTFTASDQTYQYNTVDAAEFARFSPGSQWILEVNAFGNINDIRSK